MEKQELFSKNTYIIVELPKDAAEKVIQARLKFDTFRAALPAEITITGSSGVGVIDEHENSDEVFSVVEKIASETAPFEVEFGKVKCFPNTSIYYFSIEDERPFQDLHNQFKQSNIKFKDMVFPYTPHCTISSRENLSNIEAMEILELNIHGTFIVNQLSVLALYRDENGIIQFPYLYKTTLTGS